ncbi:furin-like [Harpegnathos saltator]|uniref:furin-like n=1 Tax=Harpegnathos saltator TaxID=610380 RepID=UPI000DBEE517|nr:furin-like [Harpegnathos saltator]XP_025162016.1 furin-like [Harpegnathos saltator]
MILRVTLLVCALLLAGARSEPRPRSRPAAIYSNQFAVYVPSGPEAADEIAQKRGFDNHGQVSETLCVRSIQRKSHVCNIASHN